MIKEVEDVFNEVRLSMHALVQAFNEVHAKAGITVGMRAVLEFLDRNGSRTVPQIARARHVTRQHIQNLVNQLLDGGFAELAENPHHKRSSLVQMTTQGRRQIRAMRQREHDIYLATKWGVPKRGMKAATEVLRKLRRALLDEVAR